jgi:hypothetical protein
MGRAKRRTFSSKISSIPSENFIVPSEKVQRRRNTPTPARGDPALLAVTLIEGRASGSLGLCPAGDRRRHLDCRFTIELTKARLRLFMLTEIFKQEPFAEGIKLIQRSSPSQLN